MAIIRHTSRFLSKQTTRLLNPRHHTLTCKTQVLNKSWINHLKSKDSVQIKNGCLFKCAELASQLVKKPHFDYQHLENILTSPMDQDDIIRSLYNCYDFDVARYIQAHLYDNVRPVDVQDPYKVIGDSHFITMALKHNEFSSSKLTGIDIQQHFEAGGGPFYSFVKWGLKHDEVGYTRHVILVIGIGDDNQLIFYDVSDKLPSHANRIRKMDVHEFNFRRDFPIHMGGKLLKLNPVYLPNC